MLNPFDLSGPAFLAFYSIFCSAVLAALHWSRRRAENGAVPKMDFSDPYLLAYLRGGAKEAARVAAISLVDRGLLQLQDDRLFATRAQVAGVVKRPIERAIVEQAKTPTKLGTVLESPTVEGASEEYQNKLRQQGLLPDRSVLQSRAHRLQVALILILGVAIVKIVIALLRERYNILFLILLAVGFSIFAAARYSPERTSLGDALIADLTALFAPLKKRARMLRPGGATAEAALLMAVFGVGSLPAATFPIVSEFEKERRRSQSTSGSGSGCSSCSGCGGGGGGCGGCGGD